MFAACFYSWITFCKIAALCIFQYVVDTQCIASTIIPKSLVSLNSFIYNNKEVDVLKSS